METQRFERLMEYFKNEDNNIDFMVCYLTHTHSQKHKNTPSNELLIAPKSLKDPT